LLDKTDLLFFIITNLFLVSQLTFSMKKKMTCYLQGFDFY